MNVILLSGGSGTRLWPLSNDVRSKQFLRIFKTEDGKRESMAQRMYRMLKDVDGEAFVVVATSSSQIPQIRAQLGYSVGISEEPCRRDTFPAIVLAAAYLKKRGMSDSEPVVVCPVDPYVDRDYFECLHRMSEEAERGRSSLLLMGIEPTCPSEKFGYVIPENKEPISPVLSFREKPDRETALRYIESGALWNGGVFAFRLGYLLEIARRKFGTSDYDTLFANYETFEKISFDYAVAEKEKDISVLRFRGQWADLGTWNSLTEAMPDHVIGNAKVGNCLHTHIINELSTPLVALGLRNTVVAATPDGILVADKEASASLKEYVSAQRPMYELRSWGEYKVLNYSHYENGDSSIVKELILKKGGHISYQKHANRMEMWGFTEGRGELVIEGKSREVTRGDSVVIPAGTRHAIRAVTELHIIEVQIGASLSEEDIERLDWDWE